MKELSLHILDIVNNSVSAKATRIGIDIAERDPWLYISITDNGCGMDAEFVARVTDPFTTTRTTRKVGMGLPLLKLAAEQTGGALSIDSQVGVGTTVTVTFGLTHIDRPPLGDMTATMVTLIQGAPDIDFTYTHHSADRACTLDTAELRLALEEVPLDTPDVLAWIQAYLTENDFSDTLYSE